MKKLVNRTYKFRIFPSRTVAKKLEKTLDACRFLYNSELEYEKQAYFFNKEFVSKVELNNLIPSWKAINPSLKKVHSQVLQNVSDRLVKSFEGFFGRIKHGEKAGFPRFKSRERYDSFTYPQSGFKVEKNKLKLSKIGLMNVKLHRKIKGKIKTLTISKTSTNKWFACFSVVKKIEAEQHDLGKYVGLDVGLNSFYADSECNKIENPRRLRKSEERLKFLQRQHSKKKKGSKNRNKSKLRITRLHEKVVNQRNDFLHKESRRLVNEHSLIAVEKLSIKSMVKNHYLAKSIGDAGWRRFLQYLAYKAEEAGGRIVEIDARGTSQHCICGNRVEKSLSVRIHKCNKCGLEIDRDVMSAIIIKASALKELENTVGTAGINACRDAPLGMSMKQEWT
ncbi:IS200/IS605 family element transposase accessory protein TnpB, partial [Candidatus Woesearchaeota archaeon]|nr:IS200/IS605 family element transposase accessory protein TnpB [Candidatus Woesearchaeota archaeon]